MRAARNRCIAYITAPCLIALALPALASSREKLQGYADFRIGKTLVVDGQQVRINGDTKFKGSGKAKSFETIPPGYEVEVNGTRLGDGSVLARDIEAQPNRNTDIEGQMKQAFDQIEKQYLSLGRMKQVDDNGKVVEDLGPLLTTGPQVERVRGIMTKLVPSYVDPAKLRVYVVDNPEWNAMAAPNFSIYVFSGLLKDMDDDEVAIVLGHELTHASYEHSRRQYERSNWVQYGAGLVTILASELIKSDVGKQAAQAGTVLSATAIASGYSRDHEDQADRVGLRYAFQAGYNVNKGPRLWKRFSDKYGDQSKVKNFFFGDHSRASVRAELLREEIKHNHYKKPKTAVTAAK